MVYLQFNVQTDRVKCIAFHPRRPWLIFSCQNGYVELWDYVTETLIDKFRAHNSPVRCIDFHSTQPLIVTGGDDATIKLWSLTDRKLLHIFTGHTDYVRSVFFHPDVHPYILSASDDNTARIWNWQSRQRVADLVGHRDLVMCARWHPTEDLIVTASMDTTVRVWDISSIRNRGATGRIQQLAMQALALPHTIISASVVGTSHGRGVNWVSWMPDAGNYFISGSDDTKCKVWRITRGTPQGMGLLGPDALLYCSSTIEKHTGNVSVVEPSARNVIFTAGTDGKLCLFSLGNRSFVGGLTVQDLNPQATLPQSLPADQKILRWWSLREHPTLNLWAAGHDAGLCVFSTQLDKPVGVVEGCKCYIIDSHRLISTNMQALHANINTKPTIKSEATLIKQAARDGAFGSSVIIIEPSNLIILGDPFPFVAFYWDGKNRFIVPYTTVKDCSPNNYDPKNVIEILSNVARLSSSHIAWLQASSEGMVLAVAFVGIGGLTVKETHPVPSTSAGVFPGRADSEVIVVSSTGMTLYSIEGVTKDQPLTVLHTLPMPSKVDNVCYSKDRKYIAVTGRRFVVLLNTSTFTVNTSQAVHTTVYPGVWALIGRGFEDSEDRSANAFVYSTSTHICYILPFVQPKDADAVDSVEHMARQSKPVAGVLTSLNRPIFILSVVGQTVVYLDNCEGLKCIEFDSRIAGLIQAIVSDRTKDISTMIARLQANSPGVSLSKRLLDMNRPDLALVMLPKNEIRIRDELALNLGLLEHVDCSKRYQAEDQQLWLRIFAESLSQGQGLIARDALIKLCRMDLLGFLVSLYNSNLEECVDKIDYDRLSSTGNIQECLNGAIMAGDKKLFYAVLQRAGLSVPARIFGAANGLTSSPDKDLSPGSTKEGSKPISIGKKMQVPLKKGSLRNYKTVSFKSSYDELIKYIALAIDKETPASGENYHGWGSDSDENDYIAPPPKSGITTVPGASSSAADTSSSGSADQKSTITAPSHGTNVVLKHPLFGTDQERKAFFAENGITAEDALKILGPYLNSLCEHNKKLQSVAPMKGLKLTVPISDSLVSTDSVLVIQRDFNALMQKVDAGAFGDAVGLLRTILQRTIFARSFAGGNDYDDLSVLLMNSALYVNALSCELERRSIEKTASPERICELYVLFALCNMTMNHALLALRLAITGTKKHGAYSHCKQLAQRFVQLAQLPEARNLEICQSYLPKAKKLSTLEEEDHIHLSFSAEDQNTVGLCVVSYKSVTGVHCVCSACKSCACDQYVKAVCPVCQLGVFVRT